MRSNAAGGTIYTIGHSTRTLDSFVALLHGAGVTLLVDVRSIPRSRTVPQFNIDVLPASLAESGVGYKHLAALGGRRHRRKGAPESVNTYWKVAAFRSYADYAETPEFRAGLDELIVWSSEQTCAIMCAEAVWWRCHRRIIADYLLSQGQAVNHIMGPDKFPAATMTPGARVLPDGTIQYVASDLTAADGM